MTRINIIRISVIRSAGINSQARRVLPSDLARTAMSAQQSPDETEIEGVNPVREAGAAPQSSSIYDMLPYQKRVIIF
jgi:hypothetical protein